MLENYKNWKISSKRYRDRNISALQRRWSILMKKNLHLQLIESKEALARNNQISKQQMNDMQMNIAFFTETNKTLDKDLQTASKTIVSQENSKTIRTNWKIDANTKFTISAILLTG